MQNIVFIQKYHLLIFTLVLWSCSRPQYKNPHVLIETNFGDIEAELFPEKAPRSVAAFLSYIDSGYYNNSSFYRVVKTEDLSGVNYGLIQGGTWLNGEQRHPHLPGIVHESTKQSGLSHTSGTLSLARTDTGTANTEFFICVGDQSQLDYGGNGSADGQGYAAFGKVFKGMDIVRMIQDQKSSGERFVDKITIEKVRRL
jgi:peptidyl-prolyl cis-trans isomerase A (cyclophilin A)